MRIYRYKVAGMCCPVEGQMIEKALRTHVDIQKLQFDYAKRILEVHTVRSDPFYVQEVITNQGFRAELCHRQSFFVQRCGSEARRELFIEQLPAQIRDQWSWTSMNEPSLWFGTKRHRIRLESLLKAQGWTIREHQNVATVQQEEKVPWGRYGTALVFALTAEFLELGAEWGYWRIASWSILALSCAAILLAGLSTFRNGLYALYHRQLTMNTLMSVAVVGALAIGAYPEAAMVMSLFQISEALESLAVSKAQRSIHRLMQMTPEVATVYKEGQWRRLAVEELCRGDIVRVSPGERVPVDGVIVKGHSAFDQSSITGRSLPVEKGENEAVWGGVLNQMGVVEVRVTATVQDSLTARMIAAVEQAQQNKSPIQRFVDRFAAVYTPIVFVVALMVAFVPPLLVGNWFEWLYRGLCLLVIACPCALVISTPVTVVSALANASRQGLLIKGGAYLEQARHIQTIAFDKTGTVTKGRPVLVHVYPLAGLTEQKVGALALALASLNAHPLSQAIVKASRQKGWTNDSYVEHFEAIPGQGVQGHVNRSQMFLLSPRAVQLRYKSTPRYQKIIEKVQEEGGSCVVLTDILGILGVFTFQDLLKEHAKEDLMALHQEGVRLVMLTGDAKATIRSLGKDLPLDQAYARLLPEEKLGKIRQRQEKGLVAMVGDGMNDAPALAQSDLGISMGVRGMDCAIEASNVVVMDDRLGSIVTLIRLSRQTHRILWQNIAIALGVKFVFALLAVVGSATMWMAVFADVGVSLIVIMNGLRMLRYQRPS